MQEAARAAGLHQFAEIHFRASWCAASKSSSRVTRRCELSSSTRSRRSRIDVEIRAGTGYACTEAPRGILYHRYRIDEHGTILDAKIVPPTSQNQKTIEQDLGQFVSRNVALPEEELRGRCEQVVHNYDPCISCSTHFLKLRIDRI